MGATAFTDHRTRSDKMLAKREESIYALRNEAHRSRLIASFVGTSYTGSTCVRCGAARAALTCPDPYSFRKRDGRLCRSE
jgi:hypothetical protein